VTVIDPFPRELISGEQGGCIPGRPRTRCHPESFCSVWPTDLSAAGPRPGHLEVLWGRGNELG
jgi:hypothetical protein